MLLAGGGGHGTCPVAPGKSGLCVKNAGIFRPGSISEGGHPPPLIFIRKNYDLSPEIFQYGFGDGFRIPYHFSEALASSLAVLWNGVETVQFLIFGAADFASSPAATEVAVHAGARAQVTLFCSRASFFACQAGRRTGTKNGPPARGGRLFSVRSYREQDRGFHSGH